MTTLSDIGQAVAMLATAAGTTGGGVAWIWNKIEARFAMMRADHAEAIRKIEAEAERCEAREKRSIQRHGIITTAMELLWRVAERAEPAAPELTRATVLMDKYKALGPIEGDVQ
jgi:hypothetical protein